MARCRADKFTRLAGKDFINRSGIFALDRFTGENDSAAINIPRLVTGALIGLLNEESQSIGINRAIAQKGREHDGRAPNNMALDHHKAAGEALCLTLQNHPRK